MQPLDCPNLRGCSSVGRALASQAKGRGFDPRRPLSAEALQIAGFSRRYRSEIQTGLACLIPLFHPTYASSRRQVRADAVRMLLRTFRGYTPESAQFRIRPSWHSPTAQNRSENHRVADCRPIAWKMPPLRIPQRYRVGLAAVDRLTDSDVELIQAHLAASEGEVSIDLLAGQLSSQVETEVDLEQLLEAVASLTGLLPEDGEGAEALAVDVSESSDLTLARERPEYAARLLKLMEVPVLAIAARAMGVVTDHDKVFHEARILTDVRPIFERDVSSGVKAATVSATMKVEYHAGGRSGIESFFVTLDRGDLEHLRRVVDRALAKMDGLSDLLSTANVPQWTSNFHDHGSS